MHQIKGKTFADLYMQVMKQVLHSPDYISKPRGLTVRECLNVFMEIEDPSSNLFKCSDKSLTMPTKYTKTEIALYLSGTNELAKFAAASPFWTKIANPDGRTINSAYGNLIFNPSLEDGRSQFEWAFDCLAADKDSRQAFMRYNSTCHQYSGVKDLPCTFIQAFHIRDSKLFSTVTMRSNDIVKGLVHDVPSFTLFQQLMLLKLREVYPELQLGTYSHLSHSLHVYEDDFELVQKRIDAGIEPNSYPFPQDADVVKSDDINRIIEMRIGHQIPLIDNVWKLEKNIPFYSWLTK